MGSRNVLKIAITLSILTTLGFALYLLSLPTGRTAGYVVAALAILEGLTLPLITKRR